jgi:hypothetical protein
MTYVGLAYVATHNGDFYQVRRWKAALWFANIFGVILSALFIFFSVTAVGSSAVEKNAYEIIGQIIGVVFSSLTFIVPFLFVVAIGTQRELEWWPDSDDYLDKIWKDPNKGHKSPIQEP